MGMKQALSGIFKHKTMYAGKPFQHELTVFMADDGTEMLPFVLAEMVAKKNKEETHLNTTPAVLEPFIGKHVTVIGETYDTQLKAVDTGKSIVTLFIANMSDVAEALSSNSKKTPKAPKGPKT